MNIDKLKELASKASQMPWEPAPEDVPHSARWAFREAVKPEEVLALIEVAEKAMTYQAAREDHRSGATATQERLEAWEALRSALSRLHGGQG